MKVSEAKNKVCPFIQNLQDIHLVFSANMNYKENQPANIYCICGSCMAWKCTEDYEALRIDKLDDKELFSKLDDGWEKYGTEYIRKKLSENEKIGYCTRLGK